MNCKRCATRFRISIMWSVIPWYEATNNPCANSVPPPAHTRSNCNYTCSTPMHRNLYKSSSIVTPNIIRCVIPQAYMLPISCWKSSSSFWTAAYFFAISSYFCSHWSRSFSRACTFLSKCPALTSIWRSLDGCQYCFWPSNVCALGILVINGFIRTRLTCHLSHGDSYLPLLPLPPTAAVFAAMFRSVYCVAGLHLL